MKVCFVVPMLLLLAPHLTLSQSVPTSSVISESALMVPLPGYYFACRAGVREIKIDSQNFEMGDTWSGNVAVPRICGGCYFENAPGSPPSKANPREPINMVIHWGDGTVDRAAFTSASLSQGPLTLSSTGLAGSHTYKTAVKPLLVCHSK